jgi:signal peptidase I
VTELTDSAGIHQQAREGRRSAPALVRVPLFGLRAAWLLARVAVLVAVVGMLVAWRGFGYTPVAVTTGSMAPKMSPHTLLFVHAVDPESVRVGDVITFDPPGRVPRVSHRVVAIYHHDGKAYFQTKGDANPVADDWRGQLPPGAPAEPYRRGVTYGDGQALCVRWHVHELGRIATIGAVPHLRTALISVPFIAFGLLLLTQIWSAAPEPECDAKRNDETADAPVAAGLDEAA